MKTLNTTLKTLLFGGAMMIASMSFAQGKGNGGNGGNGQNGQGNNDEFGYNCNAAINLTMVDGEACIDVNATNIRAHIMPASVRSTTTLSFSPACFYDADLTWTLASSEEIDGYRYDYYESNGNGTTATISHSELGTLSCSNSKVNIKKTVVTKICNIAASASTNRSVVYYGSTTGMDQATLTAGSTGANGSVTYSWSNGASGSPITVNATSTAGTTTYTVTATDSKGCTATASVDVETKLCGLTAAISANRTVVYFGAPLGYNSATLTASYGGTNYGAVSYTWSTSSTNTSITVTPTSGSNTYTVNALDAVGCPATASVNVCAFDVRCGNALDKVSMRGVTGNGSCNQLCVAVTAVSQQLANGRTFGTCGTTYTCAQAVAGMNESEAAEVAEVRMAVAPNPFNGTANIQFTAVKDEVATLTIFNMAGKVVKSYASDVVKGGTTTVWGFTPEAAAGNNFIAVISTASGLKKSVVMIMQ